ncbi:MAG: hypothetical protein ACRC8A_19920 [Microcoleaceae cyanobacterium]
MDTNSKPTRRNEWVGQAMLLALILTFLGTMATFGQTLKHISLLAGCIVAGEGYRRNQHNKAIEVDETARAETDLMIQADRLAAIEQIESASRKAEIASHIARLHLEQVKLEVQMQEFNV